MTGNNPTHTQPPVLDSIEAVIEGLIDWADSGHTSLGRPDTTLAPQQAAQTLKDLCNKQVAEAIAKLEKTIEYDRVERKYRELKAAQPHKGKE